MHFTLGFCNKILFQSHRVIPTELKSSACADKWRIWTVSLPYKNLRLLRITSLEMPLYADTDTIFLTNLQKGRIVEMILPLDNMKIQVG